MPYLLLPPMHVIYRPKVKGLATGNPSVQSPADLLKLFPTQYETSRLLHMRKRVLEPWRLLSHGECGLPIVEYNHRNSRQLPAQASVFGGQLGMISE
jgi:hypothetical protein